MLVLIKAACMGVIGLMRIVGLLVLGGLVLIFGGDLVVKFMSCFVAGVGFLEVGWLRLLMYFGILLILDL